MGFLTAATNRALLIGVTLAQPFLINEILSFQSDLSVSPSTGYGLIGAYALVYSSIGFFNAQYMHHVNQFALGSRALLVDSIFKAGISSAPGVLNPEDGRVSTLVNVDVENAVLGFRAMHDIWACAVTVGVCLWLLFRQLRVA